MEIGKSLSYVFEDEKWIEKVLIAALITFVGVFFSFTMFAPLIASALLLGYSVEIVSRVRARNPNPLPEWDDWGRLFVDGVKLMLLYLIYAVPAIILLSPGAALISVFSDTSIQAIAVLLGSCLFFLAILYGILYAFFIPGITVRYANTREIIDSLDVAWLWDFTRDNAGDVIAAVIVVWLVTFVANFVGLLICGIGLFFTSVWTVMVQSHLYGQIGLAAPAEEPARENESANSEESEAIEPLDDSEVDVILDDDIAVG
ncbi:MAG: DUF4013 domain-containing protein [Chloroflexi bacterium]|nr:DUF4013 domain-containing protein [Chloroflexota bacterium]